MPGVGDARHQPDPGLPVDLDRRWHDHRADDVDHAVRGGTSGVSTSAELLRVSLPPRIESAIFSPSSVVTEPIFEATATAAAAFTTVGSTW